MMRPSDCWDKGKGSSNLFCKEKSHALNNFRDFARAVAVGTGHFIHDGWIHPHPVGFGHH